MTLSRWRKITLSAVALSLLFLAACSGSTQSTSPTPTPSLPQGQQLLNKTSTTLNSAKTLQGLLDLKVSAQSLNGTLNTTIWNAAPAKNRTEVRQSSLSQSPVGSITVTDGKTLWQYNPAKKIVYSGPTQASNTGGLFGSGSGGQSQFLLNFVQSVFTQSNGTLKSSTGVINGHAVYDIGVVPQDNSTGATGTTSASFTYSGDIYVDKATSLPIEVSLDIQGFGKVVLDFPKLVLNQPIPANTFTFVAPAGTKELPLQQSTQPGGSDQLNLAQAQKQASFHLLSIPADQADYVLLGVNALGAPGNQIYTLHYMKGNLSFTLAQGKPLANLSANSGQHISLRGTTALFSNQNSSNILTWTEKGVGINITGLSQEQAIAIAKALV